MPTKNVISSDASAIPDQRHFWDQWHRGHSVASHVDHAEAAVNEFVGALPVNLNRKVLEIGCGQGREALNLTQQGLQVSALDHSTTAIDTANRLAKQSGARVNFLEHDATQPLPYGKQFFSGVFSHLSLHYFDDETTQRVFDEIARVTMPGGALYFTVRSVRDPLHGEGARIAENMYCRNGHVRHFFSVEYVRKLLSSWRVELADYYDTADRTVNPGVFIRVLAYNQ
jgi:SAM-dependent methyltransferase